jgi:hypothetical protein
MNAWKPRCTKVFYLFINCRHCRNVQRELQLSKCIPGFALRRESLLSWDRLLRNHFNRGAWRANEIRAESGINGGQCIVLSPCLAFLRLTRSSFLAQWQNNTSPIWQVVLIQLNSAKSRCSSFRFEQSLNSNPVHFIDSFEPFPQPVHRKISSTGQFLVIVTQASAHDLTWLKSISFKFGSIRAWICDKKYMSIIFSSFFKMGTSYQCFDGAAPNCTNFLWQIFFCGYVQRFNLQKVPKFGKAKGDRGTHNQGTILSYAMWWYTFMFNTHVVDTSGNMAFLFFRR